MQLATTRLGGNIRITGVLRSNSSIVIESPPTPDKHDEPDFIAAYSGPVLEADEIDIDGHLEICAGAKVVAKRIQTHHVRLAGELVCDHVSGANIFEASGRASIRGHVDFPLIIAARTCTLEGGVLQLAEANAIRAKALLDHPEDVDLEWLRKALELIGWHQYTASSSGNGGNFGMTLNPDLASDESYIFAKDSWSMYVPFHKKVHDFKSLVQRSLREVAQVRGLPASAASVARFAVDLKSLTPG